MKKFILASFVLIGLAMLNPVSSLAYDNSVMMPVPRLCPSKFSYYTACEQYGMGCKPTGCPGEPGVG